MRKGVLGAGIALLVLSLIMTPAIYLVGMNTLDKEDPSTDYEKKMVAPGGSQTIQKGEYDIWVESTVEDVEITDPDKNDVQVNDPGMTMPINDYEKIGTFEAGKTGVYTLNITGSGEVYITKPIDTGLYSVVIYGGLSIGGIILIAGLVLLVLGFVMKPKRLPRYHPPKRRPRPERGPRRERPSREEPDKESDEK